jgi:hypothetical protein
MAEFAPVLVTARAVTWEGADGVVTATTPPPPPPPPPPALPEVVNDAVAGSDDPPELFATIWNLYVVPDDKPLTVAVDAGAVIVLVIGEPPPIGVAVTV